MANPDGALGGGYNPKTDYVRTGATDTGGTYAGATFTGATTFTGTATASKMQTQALTATGTGSGDATQITIGTPGVIYATGAASGVGIGIPTGAGIPGASYDIRSINTAATGTIQLYAVGGTINGVSGATGVTLSATGTRGLRVVCGAAGAWWITGITTT